MKKYQLVIIPLSLMSGNRVIIEHETAPDLVTTLKPLMAKGLMIGKRIVLTRVLLEAKNGTLKFGLYSATDDYLGVAIVQEVK